MAAGKCTHDEASLYGKIWYAMVRSGTPFIRFGRIKIIFLTVFTQKT